MTPWDVTLIGAGGFAAGAVNAMAGGGTFFSFPALLAVGLPPVVANASNSVALWPGSLAGAWAYRRELVRYFEMLSPDFRVHATVVEDERDAPGSLRSKLARGVARAIPSLRSRLHVEIDLPRKARGIAIQPHW